MHSLIISLNLVTGGITPVFNDRTFASPPIVYFSIGTSRHDPAKHIRKKQGQQMKRK